MINGNKLLKIIDNQVSQYNNSQAYYFDIIAEYQQLCYKLNENNITKESGVTTANEEAFKNTISNLNKDIVLKDNLISNLNNQITEKNKIIIRHEDKILQLEKELQYVKTINESLNNDKSNIENKYLKLQTDYEQILNRIQIENERIVEKFNFLNDEEEKFNHKKKELELYEQELKSKLKKLSKGPNNPSTNNNEGFINDNIANDFVELKINIEKLLSKKINQEGSIVTSTSINSNKDLIFFSTEDSSILSYSLINLSSVNNISLKEKVANYIDCDQQNNNNLLFSDNSNKINLYDLKLGKVISNYIHKDKINCCKFFEGNKIFSCALDNTVRLWDIKKGNCITNYYTNSGGTSGDLSSNIFYTGHRNGSINAWSPAQKSSILNKNIFGTKIDFIKVNENEDKILCSSRSTSLTIFDIRASKKLLQLDMEQFNFTYERYSYSLDLDYSKLFIGDNKGNLIVYDITSEIPKIEKKINLGNCEINHVSYNEFKDIITCFDIKGNIYFNKVKIDI